MLCNPSIKNSITYFGVNSSLKKLLLWCGGFRGILFLILLIWIWEDWSPSRVVPIVISVLNQRIIFFVSVLQPEQHGQFYIFRIDYKTLIWISKHGFPGFLRAVPLPTEGFSVSLCGPYGVLEIPTFMNGRLAPARGLQDLSSIIFENWRIWTGVKRVRHLYRGNRKNHLVPLYSYLSSWYCCPKQWWACIGVQINHLLKYSVLFCCWSYCVSPCSDIGNPMGLAGCDCGGRCNHNHQKMCFNL